MSEIVVPDSIEPVRGYKCLCILEGRVDRLESLAFKTVWEPRVALEAVCMRGHSHMAPHSLCGCGIYIASHHEAMRYYGSGDRIMLEVAGWGLTKLHYSGARTQFAYPQKIVMYGIGLRKMVEIVAETYGIPFEESPGQPFVDRFPQGWEAR